MRHKYWLEDRQRCIDTLKEVRQLWNAAYCGDFPKTMEEIKQREELVSKLHGKTYEAMRRAAHFAGIDSEEWDGSDESVNVDPPKIEEPTTYKGDLAGFPVEVVEKMLERQFEQTGKRDVSVFEANYMRSKLFKGFDWDDTIEGEDFWREVISRKNIYVFFERYPKTEPQPESADLHQQIADLQARLDLAVKALEDIGNEFIGQKGYESLATYLDTLTQIKGGADD